MVQQSIGLHRGVVITSLHVPIDISTYKFNFSFSIPYVQMTKCVMCCKVLRLKNSMHCCAALFGRFSLFLLISFRAFNRSALSIANYSEKSFECKRNCYIFIHSERATIRKKEQSGKNAKKNPHEKEFSTRTFTHGC